MGNISKKYGVVILNRYPELANKFIQSIRDTHEELPAILVVRDRTDATYGDDILTIDGREPFSYSKNANIGIQYFANRDIAVCNDDLECMEKDFFPRLHAIACKYPKCGVLSPLVQGGIRTKLQQYDQLNELWKDLPDEVAPNQTLGFPCVLLKRKVIRKVGLFDENITDYGYDDDDYCFRVWRANFLPMITKQLYIKHGNGESGVHRGYNFSLSFVKEPITGKSQEYFKNKYKGIL